MAKLVIVESPAKAKTISRFLGSGYDVQASFGHVRDLPESADDIPATHKKYKWAKLGVDVDNDFEPLYIVPDDKRRHVETLKKASKDADELLLATDEDREGESISWHILQLLKPKKGTTIRRIVFHEITPEAIQEALRTPREIDEDLVRAQETRRILDRLYGYTLSPLLWKKVAPRLSAGRVQSVAVRLIVERERKRRSFVSSTYWDLLASFGAKEGAFEARLTQITGKRVATGRNFDPDTGKLKDDVALLGETDATNLADAARVAKPWKVSDLETTPGEERPPQPFQTSTLQQEAVRKLRFTSKRTMQIAQQLYEGIDLGVGERVGLITYMRTDSLNLAERALEQTREVIRDLYGAEYLPKQPVRYKTKAKGAQEAHEAIRPTDLGRRPQDVKRYLEADQYALYELIWKRTVACQMLPAKVLRTSVEVEVEANQSTLTFAASGKQITFPGFLRAYVEGSDDPEAELDGQERLLPALQVGQDLDLRRLEAEGHTTKPPARYTEASLVKKLEEEGIGRPSTYASIISTIQDRGYVHKRGTELIPTFTAFAVTELLEDNFTDYVDTKFTARMENELDEIADGKRDWVQHLRRFYHGEESELGLALQISSKEKEIPYPAIELGQSDEGLPVVVKVGRYGNYVQVGEGEASQKATIPEDLAPADLTLEKAMDLIRRKASGPEALGKDPSTGQCVFFKKGRFGSYLEVAQTDAEREAGEKPRRVTLPDNMREADLDEEALPLLIKFPIDLGPFPDSGEPMLVQMGRYGAYVKAGTETRNIPDWREAARMSADEAIALLRAPKQVRGRAAAVAAPKEAIKEFGALEGAEGPVRVLDGRYGAYVTDGKTNATLPKGTDPQDLTPEEALRLLAERRGAPKSTKSAKGRRTTKAKTTRKTTRKAS